MSTLVQIESAVASLPAQEQWSLLGWLQERLHRAPKAKLTAQVEDSQAAKERWLAELDALRARGYTGKPGTSIQQMLDEDRDGRF